jgi:type II secretory pathway component PulC
MRLVAGLLALTLTGTLAYAEEAKAPEPQPTQAERSRAKVGLRVVRVMAESQQALLFDRNRGTHVLAEVGTLIGAYTVTEIDDDEVTLSAEGREVVLAAPESTWRGRRGAAPASPAIAVKKAPAADTSALAPADPYADPAEGAVRVAIAPSSEPMTNPYDAATLDAANQPPTTTEMEINPYNEPELAPAESAADPYAEPSPAKKAPVEDPGVRAFVDAMDGAVIVKTPDAAPAAPVAEPATMVSRKELNAALGDFAGLTAAMRGAFTPAGTRIDVVAPGTVFAKAGLRSGDVITSVDGQPIKSIDDAADLYIRAGSAKTANVQLLRAGKPMTLRLAIQ